MASRPPRREKREDPPCHNMCRQSFKELGVRLLRQPLAQRRFQIGKDVIPEEIESALRRDPFDVANEQEARGFRGPSSERQILSRDGNDWIGNVEAWTAQLPLEPSRVIRGVVDEQRDLL